MIKKNQLNHLKLSHYQLIEGAYNSGYENVLILEEDFKVFEHYKKFPEFELNFLDDDYSICYLGRSALDKDAEVSVNLDTNNSVPAVDWYYKLGDKDFEPYLQTNLIVNLKANEEQSIYFRAVPTEAASDLMNTYGIKISSEIIANRDLQKVIYDTTLILDFKNATLNPLEVAAAEVATAALLNPSSTGSEVKSLFDRVVSEKGDLKGLTAALFTGRAINRTANELLARSQGRVVNPNLELLFNGPTLRPFNFQFRLSPRDRGESIEIRKIIRMFKQSSAVKSAASTFFLRAPNTYKLQFFEGSSTFSSDHAFLPKIKECALLGFGVNYTPDGTFMSYENSSMVSYDITFAFQEIDPIINEDYSLLDSNSDNSIGF